jgi:hypothetical protein
MDRHWISSDELKSEKLHIWYLISVENPWNRRALIASGKTPKLLFPNRDLKAITIRQSVITNLLKQEKGRAGCPASCNPQETRLNGTVSANRP